MTIIITYYSDLIRLMLKKYNYKKHYQIFYVSTLNKNEDHPVFIFLNYTTLRPYKFKYL